MDNLVCSGCRAEKPYLMSCIHTFAPPVKTSTLGAYDRDAEHDEARELADWVSHAGSGM